MNLINIFFTILYFYVITGIYASDINGMSVTSGSNQNGNFEKTSAKSPTTTVNNTRLNSAVTNNSTKISNNQELMRIEQESEMSLKIKLELEQDSKDKVNSRHNNNNNNSRFTKQTISRGTSSTKKHEQKRSDSNFRLTPTKPKAVDQRVESPTQSSVQPIKGFRPSSVFKLKTKFLKATPPTPVTPSLLSARNNGSSLKISKPENESFILKTASNDKESEHSDENNADSEGANSFDNLSHLIEDTQNIQKSNSQVRSKVSLATASTEKTLPSQFFTSTSSLIKRSKANLVNEILQTQSNSILPPSSTSKCTSAMDGRNSEQDLVIDHLSEEEFVKLLKQYRTTKDPRLINQLATPSQMTTGIPENLFNESRNEFMDANSKITPKLRVQKLKMPKTSNILFSGKSDFSNGFVRYYSTGDYISNNYLEPVATTVDIDTNQIISLNKVTAKTIQFKNKPKLITEPTFFVNYINSKYKVRKYDSTFMDYLVNNQKLNKKNDDYIGKVVTQKIQKQTPQYRPNSASTMKTFNTGYLFNIQATTTS